MCQCLLHSKFFFFPLHPQQQPKKKQGSRRVLVHRKKTRPCLQPIKRQRCIASASKSTLHNPLWTSPAIPSQCSITTYSIHNCIIFQLGNGKCSAL
uniref:Uncharacterized protein n=1 Tax=Rhizophora mucronata TaxID=61149 RepID=A0A2P2JCT8_RHIMU